MWPRFKAKPASVLEEHKVYTCAFVYLPIHFFRIFTCCAEHIQGLATRQPRDSALAFFGLLERPIRLPHHHAHVHTHTISKQANRPTTSTSNGAKKVCIKYCRRFSVARRSLRVFIGEQTICGWQVRLGNTIMRLVNCFIKGPKETCCS